MSRQPRFFRFEAIAIIAALSSSPTLVACDEHSNDTESMAALTVEDADAATRDLAPIGSGQRGATRAQLDAWAVLTDVAVVNALDINRRAPDRYDVRLQVGGHDYRLELEHNASLVTNETIVIRDGRQMSYADAGLSFPLRGRIAGDPDSWVRVRLRGERIDGVFFSGQELYAIEPAPEDSELTIIGKTSMAAFAGHDASTTAGPPSCGVSNRHAEGASYAAERHESADDCKMIDIALVSDFSPAAKLGGAQQSEDEMVNRINISDGLYRNALNYAFSIKEVMSFPDEGDPQWNNGNVGDNGGTTPLNEFGDWKQSSEIAQRGLAHLFVARTEGGVVGLAWIGSTCSGRNATGVSNYLGSGSSSTIVAAHEIGHNFGSQHDLLELQYIMAPAVNKDATEFSSWSQSMMRSHVESVSCFVPCDDSGSDDGSGDTGDTDGTGDTVGNDDSGETGDADDASDSEDVGDSHSGDSSSEDEGGDQTAEGTGDGDGDGDAQSSHGEGEVAGDEGHGNGQGDDKLGETGNDADGGGAGCRATGRAPVGAWPMFAFIGGIAWNRRRWT